MIWSHEHFSAHLERPCPGHSAEKSPIPLPQAAEIRALFGYPPLPPVEGDPFLAELPIAAAPGRDELIAELAHLVAELEVVLSAGRSYQAAGRIEQPTEPGTPDDTQPDRLFTPTEHPDSDLGEVMAIARQVRIARQEEEERQELRVVLDRLRERSDVPWFLLSGSLQIKKVAQRVWFDNWFRQRNSTLETMTSTFCSCFMYLSIVSSLSLATILYSLGTMGLYGSAYSYCTSP